MTMENITKHHPSIHFADTQVIYSNNDGDPMARNRFNSNKESDPFVGNHSRAQMLHSNLIEKSLSETNCLDMGSVSGQRLLVSGSDGAIQCKSIRYRRLAGMGKLSVNAGQ